MSRNHRTGLVPPVSTQVAIDLALGDIAQRIARSQASRGVNPALASRHGVNGANALLAWCIFIAPMMALMTFAGLMSPSGLVLIAPLDAIGVLILIRIHAMINARGDQRLVYRIPTWVLVVAGGCYVCGIFILMFLAILLG